MSVTCEACREARVDRVCGAVDGDLFRCERCGTWRLVPYPRAASDRDAEYGDAYRQGFDDEKPRRSLEILRAWVPMPPGGRLLDVGCSDGGFLDMARGEGWEVRGLDPDPHAVEAARAREIPVLRGGVGDAVTFDGLFHAVTLWDVVEHLSNPDASVAWLAERVRDGGHVLVLTPDATSVFDRLARVERGLTRGRSQRLTTLCLNRYHLHRFTPRGLRLLFERHGFRVEVLARVQVFSLRPERYLSGFAPGIRGWTPFDIVNRALSRALFAAVRAAGIRNKLLLVARRIPASAEGGVP